MKSILLLLPLVCSLLGPTPVQAGDARKPNIIFILADDLGYGDVGCYGQQVVKTPHLDQLAGRGMRFRHFYAGSTVCAPSRCVLMTGKHTGHAIIRGNSKIPPDMTDPTVAQLLKALGYVTGIIGKWGLGEPGSVGVPNKQGFDYFYGYLNHHHAHNSYPDHLWRDQEKVAIPGNVVKDNVASQKATHSHDLFTKEALEFIDKNQKQPFFLYLAYTIPHANNERGKAEGNGMEVVSDEPYSKMPWPQAQKNHAAMITAMDRDIGVLMKKLADLKLDENTIVLFSSDNGPHKEGGADPAFFRSSGGLRGFKRSLHEGGIRVPFIVAWPGKIKGGAVNDHIGAFWDFLPTAVEIGGGKAPAGLDGVSFLPTLLGKEQKKHDFLYWEFFEGGFQQGVRMGKWKAVRPKLGGPLELYDLEIDVAEAANIAGRQPQVVMRIEEYLQSARTESPHWSVKAGKKK